jgi:glycosyltransferase involved in cell wall biosynthesis
MVCAQGVDLTLFTPRPFRPVPREAQLLFVGRLHPTKAPEVALEALQVLHNRGIRATLLLAGAPVSSEYGEQLRRKSCELGIESSVRWLGLVPRCELPDVYRRADLMLFLSRWEEPQGLTHMEAMACGVPVVAYPLGGARELLDAWPVTARVSECTGDAVANTIIELMDDPIRQRKLTEAGLHLVRNQASLQDYIGALAQQLEEAVIEAKLPTGEVRIGEASRTLKRTDRNPFAQRHMQARTRE